MEKRLGTINIMVYDTDSVSEVNRILSDYNYCILSRMGLPLREKGIHVITLVVEATTDQVSAITGKLGRLPSVEAKSMLSKNVSQPRPGSLHVGTN